ncbi:G-D-S-L family lipolytic protein [Streptomyces cinnamoneus]|uniref:G-D-S-L family lipolytic protein n=1 Tax=Streptomyces cinnamoneus TaxID=53446 RepID=A0A2G1XA73_STRCJ|nr:SGNH/GDSL hydrolase family protein [Streptomyces cinnamoneus]PHQ48130.1 G-D-S-L family lipolytic protein [Streptomyces cinnamoneus]PPT15756.1 SGNH/GDSL hydrolase family protein [Streptomyces cinnamoneus]
MLRITKLGTRHGRRHRRWTVSGALAAGAACALTLTGTPAQADTDAPRREPLPLERLFDNRAVSDDDRPRAADFDGAGGSLSAQDLVRAGWTAGRALDVDASRLQLPRWAPGRPDNVRADGQAVRLGGRGEALSFLVAGTGGDASGTGVVRYRDGSASTYTLTAPDWRRGPLTTKAVGLPHRNTPDGQRSETTRLYAVTVPVARGRDVTSVVLPKAPGRDVALHVFALSLRAPSNGWTGSWAASTSGYAAVGPWTDRTLRLIVHSSAGGPRTRIRLENTFAPSTLRIGHASVAVQRGDGATAAGRPVPLAFGGRAGTEIPAGAQRFSDPVDFSVPPDTNLLVSIHLPGTVRALPVHSYSNQVSYMSADGAGDRTAERGAGAYSQRLGNWPLLTGVDVAGGPGSVVTLGDSITDGEASAPGTNGRWPDLLARRLRAQHTVPRFGVLNHGISGNRVATDRYQGEGTSTVMSGVSAGHRLERDVLSQTSARTVIVFEGVNDIRAGTKADEVVAVLRSIAERAHQRGIRVVAATIAPCGGFYDCTKEADDARVAINRHIRTARGLYDAVFDFDAAIRDPEHPERMLPRYDAGDHLHPNDAGMRVFSETVDLRKLV